VLGAFEIARRAVLWGGTAPQTIKAFFDESPQIINGEFECEGVRYPIMVATASSSSTQVE
jgi:hypothetical protein